MRLIIAEKHSVGQAIAQAVGGHMEKHDGYVQVGDDLVTWARETLALLADHLAKPFPDPQVVHAVVVDPSLVAGIVRRIDVDAVHLPLVLGQQRLESLEVVAVDDHVAAIGPMRIQDAFSGTRSRTRYGTCRW